jgi:hypothetical protein
VLIVRTKFDWSWAGGQVLIVRTKFDWSWAGGTVLIVRSGSCWNKCGDINVHLRQAWVNLPEFNYPF